MAHICGPARLHVNMYNMFTRHVTHVNEARNMNESCRRDAYECVYMYVFAAL